MYSKHIVMLLIFLISSIRAKAENNKFSIKQPTNFKESQPDDHFCQDQNSMSWCIPLDYNKEIEPWKFEETGNNTLPYYYNFEFRVFDVQEVDDLHQTVKLDMYFYIKWHEPSIIINQSSAEFKSDAIVEGGFIPISLQYLEHLWVPDIEIYEMNDFISQKILKPLASIKINKEGILRYSTRVTILVSCYMDFEKYPFDSHSCHFRAGSYNNHDKIVRCTSKFNKGENDKGLIDMQRKLQYVINVKELPSSHRIYRIAGRDWATCGFSLELKRLTTQIIIQVYLTSTSLVIVSWLSFIIQPSIIPGRMGLLVTVFLVIINIFIGVKNQSPTANGLNAIDVFLVVCIGQVFVALLEYALVLIRYGQLAQHYQSVSINPIKVYAEARKETDPAIAAKHQDSNENRNDLAQEIVSIAKRNFLDGLSLRLFPLSFLIFLIIYSIIYVL